jgi:hypothetical protein
MTEGCVHLVYNKQQLEIPSARSCMGSSYQGSRYDTKKAGGTACPSRTRSHLPGNSPPASQAVAVLGQPSIAFCLIGFVAPFSREKIIL